jgi:hypothetical protein
MSWGVLEQRSFWFEIIRHRLAVTRIAIYFHKLNKFLTTSQQQELIEYLGIWSRRKSFSVSFLLIFIEVSGGYAT